MPHSKELVEKIAAELRKSYPPNHYRYAFETSLRGCMRNVQPDIQVFEITSDLLVCVVEIGYTRPEKIKLYHAQGIPDVRWYSKQAELVNLDVQTCKEIIEREFRFVMDPNDVWICAPAPWGEFQCPNLADAAYGVCEALVRDISKLTSGKRLLGRLGRLIQKNPASDLHGGVCLREIVDALQEYDWFRNPPKRLTGDFVSDGYYEALFSLPSQTFTTIYTNGMRMFSVIYCDQCCQTQIAYGREELTFLSANCGLIVNPGHVREYDTLESFDEFLKYHARLRNKGCFGRELPERIPILELQTHVEQVHGVALDLERLPEEEWWRRGNGGNGML